MILLHALTLLSLSQLDMSLLLERGPMVLVEEGPGGKFAQASAIVIIDAPPEKVWALVRTQQHFKDFIPKVLTSEMKAFAQSLEDENQTITVGVNVSSVLAATKAIKKKAESVK